MSPPDVPLPDPLPKRMNVGCGYDVRPGYLNVDVQPKHSPDLVADATHLPMLPSGYFEEILAQDVLEHFERARTQPALDEWSRLLGDGGTLILRVPSLLDLFEMLSAPERRGFDAAQEIVHLLYGTQAYTGDYHLTSFTPELLDGYLSRAGFLVCEASLLHGWLFDIRARKAARLDSTIEFVHNAYFRILGRPADAGGLKHHSRALDSGAVSREAFEASLRTSEEARFMAGNPRNLLRHRSRLRDVPDGSRLARGARSLAKRFAERLRPKRP